jgi:glutamyl-Q tRNA(Asp) synthetase
MSVSQPVFRFAPSPNGELHLGHALSALAGFEMAQRMDGRFLVRIEDIDVERCREEFVAQIFVDLAWLGIRWEEPVIRQSENFDAYRAAARRLEARGLLYPCFATRGEIGEAARRGSEARDPDGAPLYPGLYREHDAAETQRRRDSGEPFALRIHMERALTAAREALGGRLLTFCEIDGAGRPHLIDADPGRWGDAVIVRKDVPASYHLAVVVDDARQGVTHVVRGQDLLAATGLHRLLQLLLGLGEPLYYHHRLVTDAHGRKLAKSDGDTSLRSLRARGASPGDIRAMIGL